MSFNKLAKKLRNQIGFSLVETMIGVGLMGGIGLMVSQIVGQADKVKVSAESNANSYTIFSDIQRTLGDRTACRLTFLNKTVSEPITEIKNKRNQVQYVVGTEYNKSVILTGISLSRSGTETTVTVEVEKSGTKRVGIPSKTTKKSIPVNAQYDGAGRITGCQSDVGDHVAEAVDNAVEKMCAGLNLTYDSANKRCLSNPQLGTSPSFNCAANQTLVSFQHSNGTYTTSCVDTLGMSGSCTADQLLRRNSDSTFSCVDVKCPPNGMFVGLHPDGSPNCFTCGSGTMPMFANGVLTCNRPYCNNPGGSLQTYMAGIDSAGNAICNNLVDSTASNCSNGQLTVGANGDVKFQCCTPDCSNAGNVCLGTSFVSANNCGMCSGSLAPNCIDPQSACSGSTYTAPNGCGICPGARLPSSASWSAWSACSGGIRTRTCDNNVACGGASCVGPSIENCGCVPAIACSAIAASTCSNASAGTDSCGTSCGMGTKAPTTSCTSIAATFCSNEDAGSDSCGNSCGMGTMDCGGPPEDCTVYSQPLDEYQGCAAPEFFDSWYDISSGCECRGISGTFYYQCNNPDGMRYGTECRNK